jgi:hypothetical protein
VRVRPVGSRLSGRVRPTKPASASLHLPHLSFSKISTNLLAHRHASRRHTAVRPPHSAFGVAAISPHAAHPVLFASRSCLSCAPTRASRSLLLQSHPPRVHLRHLLPRRQARPSPLLMLMVPLRALGRSPVESRAPMSTTRGGSAHALRPKSTGPDLPSHMLLQVFRIVVIKVDRDVAYVASVCSKCFIYFRHMLQAFFIRMLHMFHTYVVKVCSKCFSCFSLMLQ